MPRTDSREVDFVAAFPRRLRALAVGLLVALVGACGGGDDADDTCTEGGKTYHVGESWTCADNCNRCSCSAPGTYTSTGKACIDGGFADTRTDG